MRPSSASCCSSSQRTSWHEHGRSYWGAGLMAPQLFSARKIFSRERLLSGDSHTHFQAATRTAHLYQGRDDGSGWIRGTCRILSPFAAMESSKPSRKEASTKEETAASAAPASQEAKRRPIKTFSQEDVSASVWSRDHLIKGETTRFYSITFERRYRDNGQYRYTHSFNPDDLGKLISLCQQAGDYFTSLQYPEPEGK